MPRKPLRPASIKKNDRRKQELIEIAMSLFASQGPDGVSLRDVADFAGIKVGTLYYYFPEKQRLYQAVVDHALALSARLVREHIGRAKDKRARLAAMIDAHFQIFSAANPIGAIAERQLLKFSTGDVDELSPDTVQKFRENQQLLEQIIAEFAELPVGAPAVFWLQQFAISSTYGVARMHGWFNQTKFKADEEAAIKANLLETLISSFVLAGLTHRRARRGSRADK
jgi:AcrR family transcriptional regulator